jgi:hypothetical protein
LLSGWLGTILLLTRCDRFGPERFDHLLRDSVQPFSEVVGRWIGRHARQAE